MYRGYRNGLSTNCYRDNNLTLLSEACYGSTVTKQPKIVSDSCREEYMRTVLTQRSILDSLPTSRIQYQ